MTKKRTFLMMFDCDGTLADSHGNIVNYMQRAWDKHSFSAVPDDETIRSIIGLRLEDAIARLEPQLAEAQVQLIADSYVEYALAEGDHNAAPLFDGMREVIEALCTDGHQLGIATGMGRIGLDRFLQRHKLESIFAPIKTADDGPGKPHPEILHQAMNEAASLPENTMMIGDSLFDIQLAKAAGARPIGVAWGYETPQNLLDNGAEKVVYEAREILSLCREATDIKE